MFRRIREAGLLWPLVLTIPALLLLVWLGFWQLDRLAWKQGLIDAIETRTKAEPVPLEEARRRWQAGEDVRYLRVRVQGRFLHDRELYVYAPSADEGPGYHVYTPMVVFTGVAAASDGTPIPEMDVLLVNRGFVPDAKKNPETRKDGLVNDTPVEVPASSYHQSIAGAEIVGLLRTSEAASAFTPAGDPAAKLWFSRDLDAMMKAFRASSCPEGRAREPYCGTSGLPFSIDAEAGDVPGGWPRGGVTLVKLPNRHLEYALTWFGLALTLIAVFGAFAAQRLKSPPDRGMTGS